jgi:ribosome-associated heat shock protein Hsp15
MAAGEQRIDKWLFFARVVKSRSLAQKLAISGAVRVNREKISHAARIVRPGDVLTISIHDRVRILKVLDSGDRRGPAPEAALLFQDLTPVRADLVGEPLAEEG